MTPSTYAFALVEQRGSRETLALRAFLAGEVKHLDKAEPEHSQRLLRMLSVLKKTESFLWILKVSLNWHLICEIFYIHFSQLT